MWNCNNPYADRNETLKRLGFKSYPDYVKSEFWRQIRARALKRAKHRCERCRSMRRLQVHHRAYDLATLAGTNIDSLTVLCRKCHYLAERPHDFGRSRYERLTQASEFACAPVAPAGWLDDCMRWRDSHREWLRDTNTPEQAARLVAKIRRRATRPDGSSACLVCGRKRQSFREIDQVKTVRGYDFCGEHGWRSIRAALAALKVGIDRQAARVA
jgi:hypothetical protein